MKRPGVTGALVHGLLLILVLGVAWFDWTRPKASTRKATDVVVWEGHGSDISAVRLETEVAKVDLSLKKDEGSAKPYAWFRIERTVTVPAPPAPKPEKKDDKDAATSTPATSPAAAPQTKVTVKEFLGSDRTKERLDKLATLSAERDLGKLEGDTLAKLGLAKPRGSLVVTTSKGERKLEIGDTAVGDRLRYVRDPASGKVFAVDTGVVADLEQADTRLLNTDLQPFNAEAVEKVVVSVGAASRTYAQVDRDKAGKSYWVAEASDSSSAAPPPGAEKDERATTWFGKIARLKAQRYLGEDENPLDAVTPSPIPSATPSPTAAPAAAPLETKSVLKLEYQVAGNVAPAALELIKVSAGPDKVAYLVRTSYTRARVVVDRFTAEEIEKDLGDLLGT